MSDFSSDLVIRNSFKNKNSRHQVIIARLFFARGHLSGFFFGLILGVISAAGSFAEELPDFPVKIADIDRFNAYGNQYTESQILPNRTSSDGRISLSPGAKRLNLIVPEKLGKNEDVLNAGPGVSITAYSPTEEIALPTLSLVGNLTSSDTTMSFICDGTPLNRPSRANERSNPYPCGSSSQNDCYDLTIITALKGEWHGNQYTELWGRDIRIEVENPKTENARIKRHQLLGSMPMMGTRFPVNSIWEPTIARNEVLVFRIGNSDITWEDTRPGGQVHRGRYEIVYSKADSGYPTCDVRAFNQIKPLAYAPFDPELRDYGFAQYQFRDPSNHLIEFDQNIRGTYPWIDPTGDIVGMTTQSRSFHYFNQNGEMSTRYPKRCYRDEKGQVRPDCSFFMSYTVSQFRQQLAEKLYPYAGVTVFGSWTRGKMTLLDGLVNNSDYVIPTDPEYKFEAKLFKDDPTRNQSGWIGIANVRGTATGVSTGWASNYNVIESLTNRFNFLPQMKPLSSNDSWIMSNGLASQEVDFAPLSSRNYLLRMDGVAAMEHPPYAHAGILGTQKMKYFDGLEYSAYPGYSEGFTRSASFQNSAASLEMNLPKRIDGFSLTLEDRVALQPVSAGGVSGKGVFLNGRNSLVAEIPEQSSFQYENESWYYGIFLDDRSRYAFNLSEIFTFPDGTQFMIFENRAAAFITTDSKLYLQEFNSNLWNAPYEFNHIGLEINAGGRIIDLFLNGMKVAHFNGGSRAIVRMQPGVTTVGRGISQIQQGFRGWVDDWVIIRGQATLEQKCNRARGFLIGIENRQSQYFQKASHYPVSTHQEISQDLLLKGYPSALKYLCYTNYQERDARPTGFRASNQETRIGQKINFPEGPIQYNQPRPNSLSNQFCLSCHSSADRDGLSLNALRAGTVPSQEDSRRAPQEWPLMMRGNLPEDYFGEGMPASHRLLDPAGEPVADEYLNSQ